MNSGESRQFTHNSSLSTVHSLAFTLAETLIVMGIIGVVAALTIPNVNKNTGEAEKVAKFKKLYAELNEAHNRATAIYGPVEKWFVNDDNSYVWSARYFNRISEFLKIQKNCGCYNARCGVTATTGCMYNDGNGKYKYLYGSEQNYLFDGTSYPRAILANGASFMVDVVFKLCNADDKQINCGYLHLDIDGPNKGKHTWGIDFFQLEITKEGIKPARYSSEYLASHMSRITYGGYDAGQWIMDFGNMDYLNTKDHTDETLSRTCKNGKLLGYNTAEGEVQSCK
ncbi:type II secretion system protein [bacterium]|nr:type II secretion system protein [bacterium]